jgi:ubiquinone/menaquinone biosynthesis C-methylase UbiE
MTQFAARATIATTLFVLSLCATTQSQEKSVKPGINDSFKNPDVEKYAKTFEGESREVYLLRDKIVKACELKPGTTVADVGAGTGLFTRLFAPAVGDKGKVIAVDISDKFLDHITKTCKDAKITNVTTLKCTEVSTELPANSVDVVFICDTYHHFEYPMRTMTTVHKALKTGGRVVIIDFHRIKGKSSDWVMGHVRAGQEVVIKEIEEVGFKQVREEKELLKENYFLVFEKLEPKKN